jgi:hypothetical protein
MTYRGPNWWKWEILENPLAPETQEILCVWKRKDPDNYQVSRNFTEWTSVASRTLGRMIKRETADRLHQEMIRVKGRMKQLNRLMDLLEGKD